MLLYIFDRSQRKHKLLVLQGPVCTIEAMQNGHADASKTVSCLKPPIRRVLIVGAGIAGLSAAHALQKQGIPFDVIDAQADVSGVWASGYEGLRAQGGGSVLSVFIVKRN